MKKRWLCAILALMMALGSGCMSRAETRKNKYSGMFFGAFDTVITLIGYCDSQAEFDAVLGETKQLMYKYHQIFDGYNAYEGLCNLYYVNHNAGRGPVQAEKELIDLLAWTKETQKALSGRINIAAGAVLSIWHDYRTAGVALPPMEALTEASQHTDIDSLVIDRENGTVLFTDPALSLDLGAVAKGYAVERVAEELLEKKMPSFILNAGGNVRCGEPPRDGRANWAVSIQEPDDGMGEAGNGYMDILDLSSLSVVTSGDYQRYYVVDGQRYHHIIDLDTLMPARYMRAVTVVTRDSGFADALSTTLFNMTYEEGMALIETLEDTEGYWVLMDGTVVFTEGMKPMLRSLRK